MSKLAHPDQEVALNPKASSAKAKLTTPRAAAVAGIVFSILMISSLVLIWISVTYNPHDEDAWLSANWNTVSPALNLLPFAGIAFLWFIGVVRDRLGQSEDRFCATVFLGSGPLFLAMMFNSAAVAGGTIRIYGAAPSQFANSTPGLIFDDYQY